MSKVCVIGLGYIGLPTASILATQGHSVVGVDVNPRVVKILNAGNVHIIEPDLDTVVSAAVKSKHLIARGKPVPADVFMICVPTPMDPLTKKADLSFVVSASESIVRFLRKGNLVIVESTIPPDTTAELVVPILRKSGLRIGSDLFVAHCPERVLPGKILTEMVQNHRVIGGLNKRSAEAAQSLYRSFVKGEIYLTDLKTAEMVKLVENSYRDVNIAFANEVSSLCEASGINPWRLIELTNKHPRVKVLSPGPGVGGHCIAVDPWFLVERFPDTAKLIRQAREVNDARPAYIARKILQLAGKKSSITVGCLGLTYKANIDDIRESPALDIVRHLLGAFPGRLLVSDPYVKKIPGIPLVPWTKTMAEADVLVLLVDHREFRQLPDKRRRGQVIIDTRGLWQQSNHPTH